MAALVAFIRISDLTGMSELPYPTATLYQWGKLASISPLMWGYIILFMGWLAVVLAGPAILMMSLGARMSELFAKLPPLSAYSWNIVGAVLGSLLFSFLSFLTCPPWVLLILPALVLLYYGRPWLLVAPPLVLAFVLALMPIEVDQGTTWSPYFRLNLKDIHADGETKPSDKTPVVGQIIRVNQCFQQYYFPDMRARSDISPALQNMFKFRKRYYELPYVLSKPADVLVLGCGVGSDIREALSHDVKSVDAVEIDPVVIKLGHELNDKYNDPRVHIICNDARNYLNTTDKKYDLIVVACLDSLAVTGLGSSVRIDSFVHTRESLHKALSLLRPGGLFVMSFGAGGSHWLRDRLYNTLKDAAGYPPLYFTDEHDSISWPAFIYVAGPPVANHRLAAPENYQGIVAEDISNTSAPRILTDDWPYLYIAPGGMDLPYLLLVFEIIALSLIASRKMVAQHRSFWSFHMFFMGAAFLLLELEAISRLSLIYGATWVTASIVINGILIMILIANFLVIKFRPAISKSLPMVFAALLLSLLANYFMPVSSIAESQTPLASFGLTVITLLPMFIAGTIFATTFSQLKNPPAGLGFNILGSVLGALLELMSIYTGVKALLIVATALYSGAYICYLKARKSDQ